MFYNKLKLFSLSALLLLLTGVAFAAPVKVVSITEDFAAIAKSVGGEHITVISLVKGSRNLHHITPKPSMVMTVQKADLLIRLGMQQDSWIDGLIQAARKTHLYPGKVGHMNASKYIDKLDIPTGKLDGSMGDVHRHGNPHYWLDPKNGIIIAKQIRDHLSEIDPKNKKYYHKNHTTFAAQIQAKIPVWEAKMAPLKKTQIVAYHQIWTYLVDAFNLTMAGSLEPVPGVPPTTRHLLTLKNKVSQNPAPVLVITASYYPKHAGQSFAKDLKGRFKVLPTNVEKGIDGYIGLFDTLTDILTE